MVETIIYLNEENTRNATKDSEYSFIELLERMNGDKHSVSCVNYYPEGGVYLKDPTCNKIILRHYASAKYPFDTLDKAKSVVSDYFINGTPSMIATIESIDFEMSDSYQIHFCNNENKLHIFYDYCLEVLNYDEIRFIELCKIRYTSLYFVDDVHSGIQDFFNRFNDIRVHLITAFKVLDDWDNEEMARGQVSYISRLSALVTPCHSLSKDTRRAIDKKRKSRTISIEGINIVLDLHVKLEGHRDRIYFAPEEAYINALHTLHSKYNKVKVIIGKFHQHL